MRVMLAHSHYRSSAPSGENLVVEQEAAALRTAGHQVSLFERRSDDIGSWGLTERAAVPARIVRNRAVRQSLRERLTVERPDVLHVHNTFPLLSPSVLLAARDAGVPVVATVHNYKLLCASGDFFREGQVCHSCRSGTVLPALQHGCYRSSRLATVPVVGGLVANRQLWRELVSAYVFISASQRDLMSSLELPEERVFVKHNFVTEPEAGVVAPHLRRGAAYVGRLDEAKGTPQLMAAWERFRSQYPESTLVLTIAGRGPLDEEVARWAAADLQVDFRGLLPRAEAQAVVAGSLAAIVPSAWQETFGLVAVEAMAVGVPPIVPAAGSFPELVTDGTDGLLFDGGVDGLTAAFARLETDADHFRQLGVNSEQTYRARFQQKDNIDLLVGIYEFARNHHRELM